MDTISLEESNISEISESMFLLSKIETNNYVEYMNDVYIMNELVRYDCELRRLRENTLVGLTTNLDSPLSSGMEEGTHLERAGAVVYLHKCAKMIARATTVNFCTEELPVIIGTNNETQIRYMDPITKLMFRNYTLTSCSPLYPNLFKDGHGTWYEYGLRLRKCSSTPENFDLHSTPKEHHLAITYLQEGLFSTQDVLQSQKARNLRHNRKTIVGREVFRNEKGEFTHPNFQHWNLNWDEIDWPTDKWQSMLTNVKTKTLSFWEKAKELVISILTVYFLFCIVKHIPKIFVFGGLIWQVASPRTLPILG